MDSMGRPIGFLGGFIQPIGFLYHTVLAAEKTHRVFFGREKKSIGLVLAAEKIHRVRVWGRGRGRKAYRFFGFFGSALRAPENHMGFLVFFGGGLRPPKPYVLLIYHIRHMASGFLHPISHHKNTIGIWGQGVKQYFLALKE